MGHGGYIQDKSGRLAGSKPGGARAEKAALNSRADQRHMPDRSSLDVRRIQLGEKPQLGSTGSRIAGEKRATLGAQLCGVCALEKSGRKNQLARPKLCAL